jgi:peptide methionine sulfoxide reductase MsrA
MDAVTIWDSSGKTGGHIRDTNYKESKNDHSTDLEQLHIIKFSQIKGLKLGQIAKRLFNAYGPDSHTPPGIR